MLNDVKDVKNFQQMLKSRWMFPYGCDGDYTSKCYLCPQLRVAFSLNCNTKVRKNIGICKHFVLNIVNESVKDC